MRPRGRVTGKAIALVVVTLCVVLSACTDGDRSDTGGTDRGVDVERVPQPAPTAPAEEATMLRISSPAFEDGGRIAAEYTNTGVAGGQNVSIPYEWGGAPEGTRSFALVLVDLHPVANSWVHWMVSAIPPQTRTLGRGASGSAMPEGSVEHRNTFGKPGYGGPQPPKGSGDHEYRATLYAVDVASLDPGVRTLAEFNSALDGHVLASASTTGVFSR